MEIAPQDQPELVTPQIPEYGLPRPERAASYLKQAATEIADYQFGLADGPDYEELIGRYIFSVAAVAQETEQPFTVRNIVEISRNALEFVSTDQQEHVKSVQIDIAKMANAIWRITCSRLQETVPQPLEAGQTERLDMSGVLTADESTYLAVLDRWAEGSITYRRPPRKFEAS